MYVLGAGHLEDRRRVRSIANADGQCVGQRRKCVFVGGIVADEYGEHVLFAQALLDPEQRVALVPVTPRADLVDQFAGTKQKGMRRIRQGGMNLAADIFPLLRWHASVVNAES